MRPTILDPIQTRYQEHCQISHSIFGERNYTILAIGVELCHFKTAYSLYSKDSISVKINKLKSLSDINVDIVADLSKNLEKTTKHDIVAICDALKKTILSSCPLFVEEDMIYIHLGLTSQCIVSVTYTIMMRNYIKSMTNLVKDKSHALYGRFNHNIIGMTHGQKAGITNLSVELSKQFNRMLECLYTEKYYRVKFSNGINTDSLEVAGISKNLYRTSLAAISTEYDLVLEINENSTQTDNYSGIIDEISKLSRFCSVIIDTARDFWIYSSMGYLKQHFSEGEIGSSAFPQKTNPIDLENAEGNAEYAASILNFYYSKFNVSRLQRDLSDLTVIRTLGLTLAHVELALNKLISGLEKMDVRKEFCDEQIYNNYQIFGETLQNFLKIKKNDSDGYLKVKDFLKSKSSCSLEEFSNFCENELKLTKDELLSIITIRK